MNAFTILVPRQISCLPSPGEGARRAEGGTPAPKRMTPFRRYAPPSPADGGRHEFQRSSWCALPAQKPLARVLDGAGNVGRGGAAVALARRDRGLDREHTIDVLGDAGLDR